MEFKYKNEKIAYFLFVYYKNYNVYNIQIHNFEMENFNNSGQLIRAKVSGHVGVKKVLVILGYIRVIV